MKRLFTILLSLCLVLSVSTYSVAAKANSTEDEDVVLLSSMSNEECKQFLIAQGVTIPEEFSDFDFQGFIAKVEEYPGIDVALGWTDLEVFSENIRDIVNAYYGRTTTFSARSTGYTLQYSTVHEWDPVTMSNYNCYAYALGRTSTCHPGDFSGQSYDDSASITDVALLVKDDLNGGLGYNCVKIQTNYPTSTNGWAKVIAVRKDTTGDYFGYNDYHFAKLSSSSWYHKPSTTAILKFNSAPSNSVVWTNERYDGDYHNSSVTYDSALRYLLYKSSHGSTTYSYTGEHYHSGSSHYYLYAYVCNDCGDRVSTVWTSSPCSGPPCIVPSRFVQESEGS